MSITVKNQRALMRKMKRLTAAIENRVAPTMDDVAKAMQLDAIQRVPKDSGDLARFIEVKRVDGGLTQIIGPGAKSAAVVKVQRGGSPFATRKAGAKKLGNLTKYKLWQFFKGYWTEFGTKGYVTKVKNKKALSDGETFYGTKVDIPARPAQPFMRPAFDVNKSWGITQVTKSVNEMLQKVYRL